jgi:arsenical pump membrane protein
MRIPASWLLALLGVVGIGIAFWLRPEYAAASAAQDYPAFVLVAGLLLIGLVADDEGLFGAAGDWLGQVTPNGIVLFAGAAVMISLVTATLNLDTSVAFLTPVLVYAGRSRGTGEALLYACLLLSNAGSLLLPGANLTNLIVLGHLRLSGGQFLARAWLAAIAALVVTAVVVGVFERGSLHAGPAGEIPASGFRFGRWQLVALGAIGAGTLLVLTLGAPAIPVLAVGVLVAAVHLVRGRANLREVVGVLGLPLLIGLFGVAVALGTVGRAWSGPAALLARLDPAGAAALAAGAAVAFNNLPAASLLAARAPQGDFWPVLVGLNIGPNLCVTGSLAWLLWLRAARRAGAAPSLARASMIGAVAVPLAIAAALAGLAVTGAR